MSIPGKISKNQIKIIITLLHACGLFEEKEKLVKEYTQGKSTHLSDMDEFQAECMINDLQEYKNKNHLCYDAADKMRKKIISLFRAFGYNDNGKADMTRIYQTFKYYFNKELNDCSADELRKFLSVLQNKIFPYKLNQYE